MDAVLGNGWRLVLDATAIALSDLDLPSEVAETIQLRTLGIAVDGGGATDDGGAAVSEEDGVLSGWFRRYGCSAAIVRPDNYVYGVATDARSLLTQLSNLADQLAHAEGRTARAITVAG